MFVKLRSVVSVHGTLNGALKIDATSSAKIDGVVELVNAENQERLYIDPKAIIG